jgi:hypothetical protein
VKTATNTSEVQVTGQDRLMPVTGWQSYHVMLDIPEQDTQGPSKSEVQGRRRAGWCTEAAATGVKGRRRGAELSMINDSEATSRDYYVISSILPISMHGLTSPKGTTSLGWQPPASSGMCLCV